jgi:hypothetical protein
MSLEEIKAHDGKIKSPEEIITDLQRGLAATVQLYADKATEVFNMRQERNTLIGQIDHLREKNKYYLESFFKAKQERDEAREIAEYSLEDLEGSLSYERVADAVKKWKGEAANGPS